MNNTTSTTRKRLWIVLGLVAIVILATLYAIKIQGIGIVEYKMISSFSNHSNKGRKEKLSQTASPINATTTIKPTTTMGSSAKKVVTTPKPPAKKSTTQKPTTNKPTTKKPTTKRPTTKPTKKIPIILYWTGWFGGRWPDDRYGRVKCGNVTCIFTSDKSQYSQAAALVFHGSAPSMKSKGFIPSSKKPPHQIWVYHNLENPVLTRKLSGSPIKSIHNGIFNVVNSYAKDGMAYAPYAEIVQGNFSQNYDPKKDYSEGKTKLIAWASSQCYPGRTQFVQKLAQQIDIDSYGKCGKFNCGRNKDCWDKISHEHKFYLSFENFICKDYVTEKFYHNGLKLGTVPIVIGGANYSSPATSPPGSYINALDFKSMPDLVAYIKKVAKNKTLYNSFFKWKASHKVVRVDSDGSLCYLCQYLHDPKWVQAASKHIIQDLSKVWGDEKKFCVDYPQNTNDMKLSFPWLT